MRLIEAVEKSVQRFPEMLAVVDQERSLTYRELWGEVESSSRELCTRERRAVLLVGQRSASLVTRFLAALLADQIPLLLDSSTPTGRLEELTEALKPRGAFSGSQDTEYLATTSGSSGRPKIVQIGFSSLHSVVRQQIEVFGLGPESRSAWVLSPGFDASLSDIGTALCSGATLLCAPCGTERELPNYLVDYEVTYIDIPPSVLSVYRPGEFPKALKTLVVGGEPSDPQVLREWSTHHRVVAVYGPTETTVCSSLSLVDEQWDAPYIGRPLKGVEYRVQDGELHIAGDTVGLGYLGSAFGECYPTGDLVGACHPVHGYHFLGRKDRQIQWRGQRVELDEIEARSATILGHKNVAVISHKEHLVLAWQSSGSEVEDEKSLREKLAEQLMPAWVPTGFIALRELPRKPSHKLDREALIALLEGRFAPELDSLASLDLLVRLERAGIPDAASWVLARGTVALTKDKLKREQPQVKSVLRKPSSRTVCKLLVTGLTGRLGRALQPLLTDFDVWSLTRHPEGSQDVQADLNSPDLGVEEQTWDFLRREIDLVLNLAGQLDLSKSFEEVKVVNALSLARLADLGCPIHQASTMAATLSAEGDVVHGGYAQSKWLAEQILLDSDCPGFTFRYGQLLGQPNGRELLALVLHGLLELGVCPRSPEPLFFDVTPVAWAAQKTRESLLQSLDERSTKVVRRGWQVSYRDMVQTLCQDFGIKEIDAADFFRHPVTTPAAATAQRALWRCDPNRRFAHRWRDFDLFLLSNSGETYQSTRAGREEFARYVNKLVER